MTGCEAVDTALTTTSKVLSATDSVLSAVTGTPSSSSSSSYSRTPRPTAEQQLKIDNLAFKADNAQIKQAIAEAKPNIQKMLRMTSCFNAEGVQVIGTSDSKYGIRNPGAYSADFSYHPKDKCLDVVRVFGWKMPARNALEFVVIYSSAISGETQNVSVEMRHEDGEWLVRRHN